MTALIDALKKAAEQKKVKQTTSIKRSELNHIHNFNQPNQDISLSLLGGLTTEDVNQSPRSNEKTEDSPFSLNLTLPASDSPMASINQSLSSQGEIVSHEEVSHSSDAIDFKTSTLDESTEMLRVKPSDEPMVDFIVNPVEIVTVNDEPFIQSQTVLEPESIQFLTSHAPEVTLNEQELTIKQEDKVKKELNLPEVKENMVSESEDFDWSLANIPVYQQSTEAEQMHQSNTVLKGLKAPSRKKNNGSKWVLLVLLLTLFLTGLAFYLLDYYESSMTTSNQALRRFELPAKVVENSSSLIKHSDSDAQVLGVNDLKFDSDSKPLSSKLVSTQPQSENILLDERVIAESKVELPKKNKAQSVKPKELKENIEPLKKSAAGDLLISSRESISVEELAYHAYVRQDFENAKVHYLKAYRENPRSLATLFGLGAIAVHNGETQLAIDYYQMAERLEPNNPKVKSALTSLRSASGSYEDWVDVLKHQIVQNPMDATLHFSLGNLYVKRKDWVNAQQSFFRALELSPQKMQYALNLAISLDNLGQYRLAIQYYQHALATNSTQQSLNAESQIKARILAIQQFLSQGEDRGS